MLGFPHKSQLQTHTHAHMCTQTHMPTRACSLPLSSLPSPPLPPSPFHFPCRPLRPPAPNCTAVLQASHHELGPGNMLPMLSHLPLIMASGWVYLGDSERSSMFLEASQPCSLSPGAHLSFLLHPPGAISHPQPGSHLDYQPPELRKYISVV